MIGVYFLPFLHGAWNAVSHIHANSTASCNVYQWLPAISGPFFCKIYLSWASFLPREASFLLQLMSDASTLHSGPWTTPNVIQQWELHNWSQRKNNGKFTIGQKEEKNMVFQEYYNVRQAQPQSLWIGFQFRLCLPQRADALSTVQRWRLAPCSSACIDILCLPPRLQHCWDIITISSL